ncbi:MAG: hypothetical protein ACJA1A_000278 [Saprospiraceae bacterium]|jgi:hypothetical protein
MNKFKLFAIALLGMSIWSCAEDEEAKDVNVKLEMVVGEESLVHGATYNINGVDLQFTNVAFYVGDMTFKNSDGSSFNSGGDNRYQLIIPGIFDYNFSIPYAKNAGEVSLDEISFIVGVDETTNNDDQTTFEMRPEGDPLGQQNPTMHWGWMGKYRFISIDADADLDGNGVFGEEGEKLVYHLGKDAFLGNIKLTPNQKIEGGANDFRINVDFEKLFTGVDFNTEKFTKTGIDEIGLANKIFANYSSAFGFEK